MTNELRMAIEDLQRKLDWQPPKTEYWCGVCGEYYEPMESNAINRGTFCCRKCELDFYANEAV